jgi:hypothetical protein
MEKNLVDLKAVEWEASTVDKKVVQLVAKLDFRAVDLMEKKKGLDWVESMECLTETLMAV